MESRRCVKRPLFFHEEHIPGSRDRRKAVRGDMMACFELQLKLDRNTIRKMKASEQRRSAEGLEALTTLEDRIMEELFQRDVVDKAIRLVNAELEECGDASPPWDCVIEGDASCVQKRLEELCAAVTD